MLGSEIDQHKPYKRCGDPQQSDGSVTFAPAAGIWTVALEVTGNETCLRETCITGFFAVEIESLDGTGLVAPANSIETAWTGRAVLRVGTDVPALTPGRQRVSITAPTRAAWTLNFEAPAEAEPSPRSTRAPDAGAGIVLTGTGADARAITLTAGTWTVAMEVTENLICDRGICTSAIFAVGIDSLDGTLLQRRGGLPCADATDRGASAPTP